jgi:hypothetical protein
MSWESSYCELPWILSYGVAMAQLQREQSMGFAYLLSLFGVSQFRPLFQLEYNYFIMNHVDGDHSAQRPSSTCEGVSQEHTSNGSSVWKIQERSDVRAHFHCIGYVVLKYVVEPSTVSVCFNLLAKAVTTGNQTPCYCAELHCGIVCWNRGVGNVTRQLNPKTQLKEMYSENHFQSSEMAVPCLQTCLLIRAWNILFMVHGVRVRPADRGCLYATEDIVCLGNYTDVEISVVRVLYALLELQGT